MRQRLSKPEYQRVSKVLRTPLRSKFPMPGIVTSDTIAAHQRSFDEFDGDDGTRRRYESHARANGVDPKGKKFVSQLARYPMDPNGWVDIMDYRPEIKRKVEAAGDLECSGSVNVKARDRQEPPANFSDYQVSDQIVTDEIAKIEIKHKTPIRGKERRNLYSQLKQRFSGKESKGNTDGCPELTHLSGCP